VLTAASGGLSNVRYARTALNIYDRTGNIVDTVRTGQQIYNDGYLTDENLTGAVVSRIPLPRGVVKKAKSNLVTDNTQNTAPLQKLTTNCFAPETPIRTEAGLVKIDDVRVGQTVKAFDFTQNGWVDRVVLKRHDNHFQGAIFTLRAGGQQMVTTAYHPFWEQTKVSGVIDWRETLC
jgi:hypothetical protein